MWGVERTPCVKAPELFAVPDLGPWWPGAPEREETSGQRLRRERAAVQLCWECPVWERCREWALASEDQQDTVCGGMTPRELRKERKERRAAAVGGVIPTKAA